MNFILTKNIFDNPVYAIELNGMEIYNPEYSQCGRFTVDPFKYYGLDEKNVKALAMLNSHFDYSTEI
jgi:hypothetical protein